MIISIKKLWEQIKKEESDGMDKKGGSMYSYLDDIRNNYPKKYLDAF